MNKLFLIAAMLITTGVKAQYVKKTEVTTMIATAVNPLKADIAWLKAGKKADSLTIAFLKKGKTADSIKVKVLTDSLNKFRPTFFAPPLYVTPGAKMDSVFLLIPKQ